MWPLDQNELMLAALTHLALPAADFLVSLNDGIPRATDLRCWLVRCNPLLQLRSVLLETESDWTQWYPDGAFVQLQSLFAANEKSLTTSGRFDCGIYTQKRFLADTVWGQARELARQSVRQSGLHGWELPRGWNYRGRASWAEDEDQLFSVLESGGDIREIDWIRTRCADRWEP
jgi:hypothetical protein